MLLLESTFPAATSISLSTDSPTVGGLDLSLLTDAVDAKGQAESTELNDFNIAQLQLEYESSFDNSLNAMHSLSSIDLLHDNPHHHHIDTDHDLDDSDYAARRMSSSAISSASAQSAHSVHTSSTAATSHSGFSAQHGQSLKRAQSPGMLDEFDSYDAFQGSPRAKRARPSLSLESGVPRLNSASPAPTNTTASAGGNSGDASANGTNRVQLPPLYSALENTSNSAPPTSHGTQMPFAHPGNAMQQQSFSQSINQGQGQNQSHSPFPTSNFAFNVTGTGLDLRRGSLPSLYSDSLAARSAQRIPSQGPFTTNQGGRYGFNSGMGVSPGPSPLSSLSAPGSNNDNSGLAGYQFPAPSGSDSANGSNGSGSTPTPTPNTGTSATGASPFGSGMTPTSTLSSAPSTSFPQTPLDFAANQQHGSSSSYQAAYGQQNQKDYERFTKDYLNGSAEWGSIARPASTPSSAANTPASANASGGGFGFNSSSGGLGGLPRISGHAKSTDTQQQQQQEWFSSNGQLVLPSPNASSSNQQQHPQTASLSPSPRMHHSSSGGSSVSATAAAAAAALNVSPAAAVQAAQVAAQVAARPARRRGKLPKPTTDFLKDWLHRHSDHPYPSEEEKKQLCHATGLSMSQVSNWMINARRRILAPAQRAPQGPTTTVPSFPLGNTHSSNVSRTSLGLTPAHPVHGHHSLSSTHLSHQQSGYGMGMGSGLVGGGMGLGLIGSGLGGMGGMGYPGQQGQHQLHTTQGLGLGAGTGNGMYAQQYRQTQQHQQQAALGHSALYDLGHLHAQRRASMPALALHHHHSQSQVHNHLSPLSGGGNGNGSLQLYPPHASTGRNSLPGPSPLPQVGYASASAYSPQPGGGAGQLSSPAPQRGYVFPPLQPSGSSNGDDGR